MKLAADFRQSARSALRGKWGIAVIMGLVASLLGGGSTMGASGNISINLPSNLMSGGGEEAVGGLSVLALLEEAPAEALAIIGAILGVSLMIGLVFGVAFFILGSIINVGYASATLVIADGGEGNVGLIFSYFHHWKVCVLSNLLRTVYTFLWSLLFIIPGIVASYSYAMVPYIVSENPSISTKDALGRSKVLMAGNRWRLFCLHMSFIGWWLLCILTLGIGFLWLRPYLETANADFYREISGTRKRPDYIDPAFDYFVQ